MTAFSNNPYDRRMERLMMTVPNFASRGVGFRFAEAQIFITATADKLVRQIIECIVVESKEKIKVVFIGGTEIEMTL